VEEAFKELARRWRPLLDLAQEKGCVFGYELHPGSWRRNPAEEYRSLSWRELVSELIPYVKALGFTQLYPSFSSVSMARTFILNDLFVVPQARGMGVGKSLLKTARDYAARIGAVRLSLSTSIDNSAAQTLYEQQGWARDRQFLVYNAPRES